NGVITLVELEANGNVKYTGAWTADVVPKYSATVGTIEASSLDATFVTSAGFANPDPIADIVTFDQEVAFDDLESGGELTLQVSGDSKQFRIRDLYISPGTNFSGGGGDRLIAISDGTTVYSVIPAATAQSQVNARWGETALPFPASATIATATAAGDNLVCLYSGGTTDYTAGTITISGVLERIA